MGYTLRPVNRNLDSINFGAFIWPMMLEETGMGYIIGYGRGMNIGTHIYLSGNHGSPVTNDGYKVSSREAKAMAAMALGFCSVRKEVNKQWEPLDERQKEIQRNLKYLYTQEIGDAFLEKIQKFAIFAWNSKGFRIW